MRTWNQRFFTSTRGRIIEILRQESCTVDDLARKLQLTDNAIRAHLTTLERDGLVQQNGVRRGSSKPASVYELAPSAEQFFPRAYGTVLHTLITTLAEQMDEEELIALLRLTGERLSHRLGLPSGDVPTRLKATVRILQELGGAAHLEQHEDHYCIQGQQCPLAAAIEAHPAACQLAEAFVSELVGVAVQEQCELDETKPRCRFLIPLTP
ncbi:putative ArsR family transcriptional regulator [Thermosporothrix hazakensis]|jgi:predicted ArsR family transcriptional regulator|uniref:Putative ArsR family transcriptional regulator n=1 Tax=Thermosporothrix hazakensis TaxID=644383 RepID=A0A326UDU6_THEHA|nr:ArsR family transcriptional regulator [Thermosporothrix hazakensis]PZW36466.1 putative ArsR family transcriptional regulator [Thermosporothrix hazakensis]GCE47121.1 hypothetical protein KTH_19900 [Thermosporothrix hazakensis]